MTVRRIRKRKPVQFSWADEFARLAYSELAPESCVRRLAYAFYSHIGTCYSILFAETILDLDGLESPVQQLGMQNHFRRQLRQFRRERSYQQIRSVTTSPVRPLRRKTTSCVAYKVNEPVLRLFHKDVLGDSFAGQLARRCVVMTDVEPGDGVKQPGTLLHLMTLGDRLGSKLFKRKVK